MIYPRRLEPGDKIAILSPASPVKEEYIDGAVAFLRNAGYEPVVMPHAKGPAEGSYASGYEDRLADFYAAFRDKDIRAILCSRGGYGAVHLLSALPRDLILSDPKWIVGYSDISALHAYMSSLGIVSLHASMAKHLTEEPPTDVCTTALMNILKGELPVEYQFHGNEYNREGEASGMLIGGNMAVLNGLGGTPYDIMRLGEGQKLILFIEDISEAIYAVERMLYRLYLSDGFRNVAGIIVGRFTDYKPDKNFKTMEEMVSSFLKRNGITQIPVAFDFPVGHVKENVPMLEGACATLSVTKEEIKLTIE